MYCPACLQYIPQMQGILNCPSCQLSISEAHQRIAERKESLEKKRQAELAVAEKLKDKQLRDKKIKSAMRMCVKAVLIVSLILFTKYHWLRLLSGTNYLYRKIQVAVGSSNEPKKESIVSEMPVKNHEDKSAAKKADQNETISVGLYPNIEGIAGLQADEIDLAKAVLTISYDAYQSLYGVAFNPEPYLNQLRQLKNEAIRLDLKKHSLKEMRSVIKIFFVTEHGYKADDNDPLYLSTENLLINRVLDRKLGNCVSLSALYFAVLDGVLPINGVNSKTHAFIRFDDGKQTINIDPAAVGESGRDSGYRKLYNIPDKSNFFLKSLNKKQFLSLYLAAVGSSFIEKKQPSLAVHYLEQAIAFDAENLTAYFDLAEIYLKTGNFSAAKLNLEKVLAIDPYFDKAFNNLGTVALNQDRNDDAVHYFEKAIELNSNYEMAYLNLGLAYYYKKDFKMAQQAFEGALKINPKSGPAQQYLQTIKAKT